MSTYYESNIKNCSVWLRCNIETNNTDGSVDIVCADGVKYSSVPATRIRLNGKNSKFLPMRYDLVKSCLRNEKIKSVPQDESEGSLVESPTPSESALYEMNQAHSSIQLSWKSNALNWMSSYANSALRCELNLSTASPTTAMRQLQSSSCGSTPLQHADESSSEEGEQMGTTDVPCTNKLSQQSHPIAIQRPRPICNNREFINIEDMRQQLQRLEVENAALKGNMSEMSLQFSLMAAEVAEMKRTQDSLAKQLRDQKETLSEDMHVV